MTNSYLRKTLKAKVEDSDYSMKGLSRAVGHGETLVRDIVNGKTKNPSPEVIEMLAKKLGCTADELYGNAKPKAAAKPAVAKATKVAPAPVVEDIEEDEEFEEEHDLYAHLSSPSSQSYYGQTSSRTSGVANMISLILGTVAMAAGVYMILLGFEPSSGAFTLEGVNYPAKGANFEAQKTAIGAGLVFAAFCFMRLCGKK